MAVLNRGLAFFSNVITWCSQASSILIIFLMLITVADVVGRASLNSPVPAATEMSSVMMMAIVFLGFAYAEKTGMQIRIDFLERYLSQRKMCFLNALACLIGLFIFAVIIWQGWEQALFSLSIDERMLATLRLPLYPARFLLVFASLMLEIQFAINLFSNISGVLKKQGIANG